MDAIFRQIEGHRDREINNILAQARGQFSTAILNRILVEFTGELSQKAGDMVNAGLTSDEISARLDATVERALRYLSQAFATRGLKDSTAYLNEKARWKQQLDEDREALIERCKISISKEKDRRDGTTIMVGTAANSPNATVATGDIHIGDILTKSQKQESPQGKGWIKGLIGSAEWLTRTLAGLFK